MILLKAMATLCVRNDLSFLLRISQAVINNAFVQPNDYIEQQILIDFLFLDK